MNRFNFFETQRSLLALFGLGPSDHVTRLSLDAGPDRFPELTVTRAIDVSNTPALRECVQRFSLRPIEDEPQAPVFDIDAACSAAMKRVSDGIDAAYTYHSEAIRKDFKKASRDMWHRFLSEQAMHFARQTIYADLTNARRTQ